MSRKYEDEDDFEDEDETEFRISDPKETVADLIFTGLYTDGAHHKQWCLEQIALKLGIDIEAEFNKVNEDDEDECFEWERGIAP